MMQTNRCEAAATIFSRVSAAPPPLISTPCGGRLVGAVDIEIEIARGIEIQSPRCRAASSASDVWRELETAPSSWILRSFSTSMSWATVEPGADAEHHARPRCRGSRLPRRDASFRWLTLRFSVPSETTVPAYAGTVDYFRRLTFS